MTFQSVDIDFFPQFAILGTMCARLYFPIQNGKNICFFSVFFPFYYQQTYVKDNIQ